MITAIATLILANTLNLESISTAGSIGFLLIFAIVNYVGLKLAKEVGGSRTIPAIGFGVCLLALTALIVQQYSSNRQGVLISLGIITACFLLETAYKMSVSSKR